MKNSKLSNFYGTWLILSGELIVITLIETELTLYIYCLIRNTATVVCLKDIYSRSMLKEFQTAVKYLFLRIL